MNEPTWIEDRDVVVLHERLIALYGGPGGLRDRGLLESALGRARQLRAYDEQADLIDLAAACTAGIVRNHPFVDGNKRTAVTATAIFLELNHHRLTASNDEVLRFAVQMAGEQAELEEIAAWLEAHSSMA